MEKLTKGQKEALEAVRTGKKRVHYGRRWSRKELYFPKNHRRSAETEKNSADHGINRARSHADWRHNMPQSIQYSGQVDMAGRAKDYCIITNLRSGCGDHRRGIYAADRCV